MCIIRRSPENGSSPNWTKSPCRCTPTRVFPIHNICVWRKSPPLPSCSAWQAAPCRHTCEPRGWKHNSMRNRQVNWLRQREPRATLSVERFCSFSNKVHVRNAIRWEIQSPTVWDLIWLNWGRKSPMWNWSNRCCCLRNPSARDSNR